MVDFDLGHRHEAPPKRSRASTMQDVARTAGVSLKSVSRVINREPYVSERLRSRVEEAIAMLDYVPDPAARSLAGSRNFVIGLLFDNPSPNYTIKVQAGVYRACVESGYHMRVDSLDSSLGDEGIRDQLERVLRHGRPDGFIVTPPLTDNRVVLETLERLNVPFVRIAPVTYPGRSPAVSIDDAEAAAELGQMLWELGHRSFAIINGPPQHGAAGMRRSGFVERLQALSPDVSLVEQDGDFTFSGGIAAGRNLFGTGARPTAIFATNDDLAAGAMVACAEVGLKVPQDISVVGFDDSWIALSVWPYLTTVHQPIEEMGYEAARMLLARSRTDNELDRRLDWRLVVRDSAMSPSRS